MDNKIKYEEIILIHLEDILTRIGYQISIKDTGTNPLNEWICYRTNNKLSDKILIKRKTPYQYLCLEKGSQNIKHKGNIFSLFKYLPELKSYHKNNQIETINNFFKNFNDLTSKNKNNTTKPIQKKLDDIINKSITENNQQAQNHIESQNQTFNKNNFFIDELLNEEVKTYLNVRNITNNLIKNPLFFGKILSGNIKTDSRGKKIKKSTLIFPYVKITEQDIDNNIIAFERKFLKYLVFPDGKKTNSIFHGLRGQSIWTSNVKNPKTIKNIIVTESVIDCLSFHQLNKNIPSPQYLSIGGALSSQQKEYITNQILKNSNKTFHLNFDKEKSGYNYTKQIIDTLSQKKGIKTPTNNKIFKDIEKDYSNKKYQTSLKKLNFNLKQLNINIIISLPNNIDAKDYNEELKINTQNIKSNTKISNKISNTKKIQF